MNPSKTLIKIFGSRVILQFSQIISIAQSMSLFYAGYKEEPSSPEEKHLIVSDF